MPNATCSTPGCSGDARRKTPGPCNACKCWVKVHPGSDPSNRPGLNPPRTCKEGDGKRVFGHDLCQKHYQRWSKYGDPNIRTRRAAGDLLKFIEMAAAADTDECIILTGHQTRPRVAINGVQMNASRAAWIVAHGDPGELHVLHTCNGGSGDTGCVNPQHLYLDTNAQNRIDMVRSHRSHHGEAHHRAKLNEAAVKEIRDRWDGGEGNKTALAREYRVSTATIYRVVTRQLWRRVA
jgi:hypothetical protein